MPVLQLGTTLFGTSKEEASEEKRKKAEKKKLEQVTEMLTPLAKRRDNSLAKTIFADE